jgi:undecaprenyl-diphosphatase
MDWLLAQDEKLLLSINGWNSSWADAVMATLSNKLVWIPGYLILAFVLFWRRGGAHFLLAAAVFIPVIILSDQVASGLLKGWIARPRPCHVAELKEWLHLVDYKCGGPYGFVSSHAANFFALATYVGWHLKPRIPWLPLFLFTVAALVGYSRIYLGVHYPSDVLVGALVGMMSGTLGILLFRFLSRKLNFPQTNHIAPLEKS